MVGLNESELFQNIESGYFGIGHLSISIRSQPSLNPNDALVKLATGVAKAIEANNRRITEQLQRAGIEIM